MLEYNIKNFKMDVKSMMRDMISVEGERKGVSWEYESEISICYPWISFIFYYVP